jgi:hypothetical protein
LLLLLLLLLLLTDRLAAATSACNKELLCRATLPLLYLRLRAFKPA